MPPLILCTYHMVDPIQVQDSCLLFLATSYDPRVGHYGDNMVTNTKKGLWLMP